MKTQKRQETLAEWSKRTGLQPRKVAPCDPQRVYLIVPLRFRDCDWRLDQDCEARAPLVTLELWEEMHRKGTLVRYKCARERGNLL